MVEFASWAMPVQYTSILEEAKYVRQGGTGIFDVSHMGELWVSGKDRCAFLEYMTSNAIHQLKDGAMGYTLCCNPDGGIIDDIMVYHLGNSYLCIVNASNTHTVFMHFLTHSKQFRVEIHDKTHETSLIALQGKGSERLINKFFDRDYSGLYYMHAERLRFNNSDVLISRSGYTGEDGFEIYLDNMTARTLWNELLTDDEIKVIPCGLGSRDILRLEMGYSLYGVDIDTTTNPLEAGLGWAVKDEQKDFIGRDAIAQAREQGLSRIKIGFSMIDKGFPRHGYDVLAADGSVIGSVRSGLYSPNLDKCIGTAYVNLKESRLGNEIYIVIRDKKYKAIVAKFPMLQPKVKRKETA